MKLKSIRFAVAASVCVAMASGIGAVAEEYGMEIWLKDGSKVRHTTAAVSGIAFGNAGTAKMVVTSESAVNVALNAVDRITFDGGRMVIAGTDGNNGYDLAAIKDIKFDLTTTGTESVAAALGDIDVAFAAGVLTVTAPETLALGVDVYAMNGLAVAGAAGVGSVTIDLSALPAGVYVVKANDKIIKFTR